MYINPYWNGYNQYPIRTNQATGNNSSTEKRSKNTVRKTKTTTKKKHQSFEDMMRQAYKFDTRD